VAISQYPSGSSGLPKPFLKKYLSTIVPSGGHNDISISIDGGNDKYIEKFNAPVQAGSETLATVKDFAPDNFVSSRPSGPVPLGNLLEGTFVPWFIANVSRYPSGSYTISSIGLGINFGDLAIGPGLGDRTFVSFSGTSLTTSANSRTWTSRGTIAALSNRSVNRVIFANGLYVAGATNGVIITSPDGITWTSRNSNLGSTSSDSIGNIFFVNQTFIAMATNKISVSSDGITWTASVVPNLNPGNAKIDFGAGVYVLSHTGSTTPVSYSSDLASWTNIPFLSNKGVIGVAYGNNKFVAMTNDSQTPTVFTSIDGISWSQQTTNLIQGVVSAPNGIQFIDQKFVTQSQKVMASEDGIVWNAVGILRVIPVSSRRVMKYDGVYYRVISNQLYTTTDIFSFGMPVGISTYTVKQLTIQ